MTTSDWIRPLLLVGAFVVLSGCPVSNYYYDDDDSSQLGNDDGCIDSACDDLEFCHEGECQSALDRRYRVTVFDGEAATTTADGGSWDVGGGAPDLLVQFGMRDSGNNEWLDECVTSTIEDSFDPTWNEYCELVFESGGTFALWGWDEDVSSFDPAGGVYWQGNDALVAVIRANGIVLDTDLNDALMIRWSLEPTF